MSSIDQQGSSLGSFPTSSPLYPHFNRPSGFWPCVKSCLVGGSDKYRRALGVSLCPVVGRSRPSVIACRTVCSGMFRHWIHHLWPQGAVPPGFNPLRRGWVYRPAPEAPEKRNADGVRGIFWTACRVGLRPCDRTHLKNGFVPHSYAGGA